MKEIIKFIKKETLLVYKKNYSEKYIQQKIIPIINYINLSNRKKFLIGGSQGIGKSSIILIIKKTLEEFYNKKVLALSLDDYYLSKVERELLANQIHPLLRTRGVPGTHNIKELLSNISKFDKNKYPFLIPIFDKLTDDRLRIKNKINGNFDVLILEGWCCGCNDIEKNYLYKNINYLEKTYDKTFLWRNFYNEKLKGDYKRLFNSFDQIIFMQAPSFKYVINWRLKQEKNNFSNSKKVKKMSKKELKFFIEHYEKITKWMLKNTVNISNLVIKINKYQRIVSVKKN